MSATKDIATALVKLSDAADRAVFLLEALAVAMEIVEPEDVGMKREEV